MRNLPNQIGVFLLAVYALCSTAIAAPEKFEFAADIPSMNEEAKQAGITQKYTGPWEYFVGGGAASFDCNGDRLPDLFIAGGTSQANLYVNRSIPSGQFRFEKTEINIDQSLLKKVLGAYPINLDNDENIDLVVLRLGKNLLLKGEGGCKFSVANSTYSFDGSDAWTTAFSAHWEKGNKFPTLAFGNYVDRSAQGSPWGTCHDNRLLRPDPLSQNRPDYSTSLPLAPGYCTLSINFTDWNNSGNTALRITNDRQYYRGGHEQLWQIDKEKMPREFTPNEGWQKLKIWGMGIAQADLNGDGKPEYALSSMGDTKLQTLDDERQDESPQFRDIAFEKQMTAHRPHTGGDVKPSTGWHVQFGDLNNDARQDLFIAKGNVEAMADFAAFDPDNLLLGGIDNKFHEFGMEAGIALNTIGRGAVIEDFNADGMLDLLVVNRKANVSLFRNQGNKTSWGHRRLGNWLAIELDNGDINKRAIGAKMTIKTGNLVQTKTLQIGGGHASGQLGFSHFGLGVAERITIRIKWPDGTQSPQYRALANNFIVIKKSANDPLYWYPVSE